MWWFFYGFLKLLRIGIVGFLLLSTNYTTTYLPSRKLSKLDEPDMQDSAGERGTIS